MKYWISYTDGSIKIFNAPNDKKADWYFRMEGDHAVAFGRVSSIKNQEKK